MPIGATRIRCEVRSPIGRVGYLCNCNLLHGTQCATLGAVQAMRWPMFGPWCTFKMAAMLDRVLGWPITFPAEAS